MLCPIWGLWTHRTWFSRCPLPTECSGEALGSQKRGKCVCSAGSRICGEDSFLKNLVISSWIFSLSIFFFPSVIFRLLGSPLSFCQGQGGCISCERALLYSNVLLGLKTPWNAWTAGTLVSHPCSSQGFAGGRVWLGHRRANVCQT